MQTIALFPGQYGSVSRRRITQLVRLVEFSRARAHVNQSRFVLRHEYRKFQILGYPIGLAQPEPVCAGIPRCEEPARLQRDEPETRANEQVIRGHRRQTLLEFAPVGAAVARNVEPISRGREQRVIDCPFQAKRIT